MDHLKVLPGFDQECIKVGANLVAGIYGLLDSRRAAAFPTRTFLGAAIIRAAKMHLRVPR